MENLTLNSNNNLTINSKPLVKIKTSMEIVGSGTELPIEIIADFTDVPGHLHKSYLEAFKYKYFDKATIYNCIDEEPKTTEEKKRDWRLNKLADIFTGIFK